MSTEAPQEFIDFILKVTNFDGLVAYFTDKLELKGIDKETRNKMIENEYQRIATIRGIDKAMLELKEWIDNGFRFQQRSPKLKETKSNLKRKQISLAYKECKQAYLEARKAFEKKTGSSYGAEAAGLDEAAKKFKELTGEDADRHNLKQGLLRAITEKLNDKRY